jgi:organic radical activating enzyme
MITAEISEIFVSIQGEGLYCGQKQVFVRFAGCNLACAYCDEPAAAKRRPKRCLAPFCERTVSSVAAEVIKLARGSRARAVSLTGGEPLLNREFIKALAPALKKAGLAVHLETNGTLYRELAGLKGIADVIAMDIKPPSSTGGKAFWDEHVKFLAVAPEKTFVKIVVAAKTSAGDFKKAVNIAAKARKAIPFFIQPATPKGGVKPPSGEKLDFFYKLAALKLEDVKILPQMHKLWGIK